MSKKNEMRVETEFKAATFEGIKARGITTITLPELRSGKAYRTNYPLDDTEEVVSEVRIEWTQKSRNSHGEPTNHVIAWIDGGKILGKEEQKSNRIISNHFSKGGKTSKRYKTKSDENGEYFTISFDDDYKPVKIYLNDRVTRTETDEIQATDLSTSEVSNKLKQECLGKTINIAMTVKDAIVLEKALSRYKCLECYSDAAEMEKCVGEFNSKVSCLLWESEQS